MNDASSNAGRLFLDVVAGENNPHARHETGREALQQLQSLKDSLKALFHAQGFTVIPTSGSTESNSLALLGYIRAQRNNNHPGDQPRPNIVISAFEHPSIRGISRCSDREGIEVRIALSDEQGVVSPEAVASCVDEQTLLVSIMTANGEIGTIQPIRRIVRAVHKKNPQTIIHSDMTQCTSVLKIDILRSGIDMATIDGTKVGAPLGIGLLLVKRGISLEPLFLTTDHHSVRPGTPAVSLLSDLYEACLRAQDEVPQVYRISRMKAFQDEFEHHLLRLPGAIIHGKQAPERLPHITSLSLPGVNHEYLRTLLDTDGIEVSTGAACTSDGEVVASVVALQNDHSSAIRFSYDEFRKKSDALRVVTSIESYLNQGLI